MALRITTNTESMKLCCSITLSFKRRVKAKADKKIREVTPKVWFCNKSNINPEASRGAPRELVRVIRKKTTMNPSINTTGKTVPCSKAKINERKINKRLDMINTL